MEANAIELSRRGYVVMALDMYGHGESTLPPDGYSTKHTASTMADARHLIGVLFIDCSILSLSY